MRKDAPTVGAVRELNASCTNLSASDVLPTPVSPNSTILASMVAILPLDSAIAESKSFVFGSFFWAFCQGGEIERKFLCTLKNAAHTQKVREKKRRRTLQLCAKAGVMQ